MCGGGFWYAGFPARNAVRMSAIIVASGDVCHELSLGLKFGASHSPNSSAVAHDSSPEVGAGAPVTTGRNGGYGGCSGGAAGFAVDLIRVLDGPRCVSVSGTDTPAMSG